MYSPSYQPRHDLESKVDLDLEQPNLSRTKYGLLASCIQNLCTVFVYSIILYIAIVQIASAVYAYSAQ